MKYIYNRNKHGILKKIAKVYEKNEHVINKKNIDKKVIKIVSVLQEAGYDAYIVGGAVRDFFIGQVPKDFDIVTNAHPKQVCKLFRRAKIIGKRFTIVLLPIAMNHYVEISTFRSRGSDGNKYGSISEDVMRRDFTCNGLYYCPIREIVIDFLNGITHIKKKKLLPIYKNYSEDPVRMLRAIKFSVLTGFSLSLMDRCVIVCCSKKLQHVSSSRITEEFSKIIVSSKAATILIKCFNYNLLKYMLPNLYRWFKDDKERIHKYTKDAEISSQVHTSRPKNRLMSSSLRILLKHFISEYNKNTQGSMPLYQYMTLVKEWLYPLTLPNIELKLSIKSVLFADDPPSSKRESSRVVGHKRREGFSHV